MKKVWALFLVITIAVCTVGCGNKQSFEESYNSILEKINYMNEQTNSATKCIDTTWQAVGADLVMEYIYQIEQINSKEDLIAADKTSKEMLFNLFYGSSNDLSVALMKSAWLSLSDSAELESSESGNTAADSVMEITDKITEYCTNFNTWIEEIEKNNKDIKKSLNNLKDKYGDKHSSEIDVLKEYYTESSLYADLALNPGGCTLSEYELDCDSYSNNIKRLKKSVE